MTALAPASLAARIARAISACVTLAGRRGIAFSHGALSRLLAIRTGDRDVENRIGGVRRENSFNHAVILHSSEAKQSLENDGTAAREEHRREAAKSKKRKAIIFS
ncbi:hypothetical protein ACVIHI_003149 [Bradyrhizobium sp. USDA 4524]